MLEGVEAIHVATVLDDCVDQLCILGHIMPASYEGRLDSSAVVHDEIQELVDTQRDLESKFESVLGQKQTLQQSTQNKGRLSAMDKRVMAVGNDLRNSTHVFGRSLRQNPLTMDNISKTQEDRAFIETVMNETLRELIERCSFKALLEAVRLQKEKKAMLKETVQKEEDGRKRIKQLQRQLLEVRREKEVEVQQRNEMIAHLKDQLQEMKAKTNMEGKYIKKCAEVAVSQTQKRCNLTEKDMKDEIDHLRQQVDEETRCNAEVEAYLRTHQADLEKKVEFWMEKYDKDVEAKQHELDVLKASKAKDLERLQEMTKQYKEYEQVVVEDRIEKEKARRKLEQEAIELRAATKLQAWWRGVMVRRGLGQYSRKKKKGKKGKKGKKKKK